MYAIDQVIGLECVGHGNPGEVAKCEHKAKVFVLDIHGGEDGGFVPIIVQDIEPLKRAGQDHRFGDKAVFCVLYVHKGSVYDHP